ncbi:MAG: magnesium transporter [Candidatus Hadarchaeales archaeon]
MAEYTVRKIVLESYPVLILSALISFAAGVLLDTQTASLRTLPLILAMIPPINGINGNVCSILGARLGSALHMGLIEAKFKQQKTLRDNLNATILMGAGTFAFIGTIFFFMKGITSSNLAQFMILIGAFFIASMVAVSVTMLCTVLLAFISFNKGLDPDNVVIPVLTSIGDVMGTACLITAAKIVMGV